MFDATALKGFVNTLTVDTAKLNAAQAQAALVATAIAARDRVLGEQRARGGFVPSYRQVVDGLEGAALTAVRPDGYILFAWQYLAEVVQDTYDALIARSPDDKGNYRKGILVFVDDAVAAIDTITSATKEVRIVASVDYARRLEVGRRKNGGHFVQQVAAHIVEETATIAKRLYGGVAEIKYEYVDLSGAHKIRNARGHRKRGARTETNVRYPSILIKARSA